MKPFDIFVTYISWGSGGKNRPVLALIIDNIDADIYPITTQYDNKSKEIQAQYFKINDWAEAGLHKQSYIDTGTIISIPISILKKSSRIGELTENDILRFLEFLVN